jgi:DNA-binding transcriptional LysR family regulator
MIELRHLRYFIAVAEEGHVTRASERLGIAQPPLSQQIKALEQAVGTPLFIRHPRGVALTDAGTRFLEGARATMATLEETLDATRRTARGEQGRLAVGFTSSVAFHAIVPASISRYRRLYPQVSLALEESVTADLMDALFAGRLDIAFARLPAEIPPHVRLEPLLDEEMLVALPPSHPLAAGGPEEAIDLPRLAEETFILYRRPSGPGLYDTIIAACRSAGFSPRIAQEAPRMLATLSLVASGLGVSIIPASMRRIDPGGIAYRRVAGAPGLVAPLYLIYQPDTLSGATRRLIEVVREELPRLAGH